MTVTSLSSEPISSMSARTETGSDVQALILTLRLRSRENIPAALCYARETQSEHIMPENLAELEICRGPHLSAVSVLDSSMGLSF